MQAGAPGAGAWSPRRTGRRAAAPMRATAFWLGWGGCRKHSGSFAQTWVLGWDPPAPNTPVGICGYCRPNYTERYPTAGRHLSTNLRPQRTECRHLDLLDLVYRAHLNNTDSSQHRRRRRRRNTEQTRKIAKPAPAVRSPAVDRRAPNDRGARLTNRHPPGSSNQGMIVFVSA